MRPLPLVKVPELLAGDCIACPAAGAAGWVRGCRVVEEERLDGVAGGFDAAGDPRGGDAVGTGELVDLVQVEASGSVPGGSRPAQQAPSVGGTVKSGRLPEAAREG
jgi:hypothetical protein